MCFQKPSTKHSDHSSCPPLPEGQQAGAEVAASAGGDFGGGLSREGEHCESTAVLLQVQILLLSPHSGQVAGKGLLHMKHHFPGTLEWDAGIQTRLSPGQNLKPASPSSHSQPGHILLFAASAF